MTINDWVGLFLGRLSKGDCFVAGGCLFTVKNVTAKKIRVESVRGGFDVLAPSPGHDYGIRCRTQFSDHPPPESCQSLHEKNQRFQKHFESAGR